MRNELSKVIEQKAWCSYQNVYNNKSEIIYNKCFEEVKLYVSFQAQNQPVVKPNNEKNK